jgi:branched-chain amino acid transport system ATP-binding protein
VTGPDTTRTPGAPVLEVRDLVVAYGGVRAVDGVSLVVASGEVAGIIGPNGAGKTSLIDAVCGFAATSGGSVWLGGSDITAAAPYQRARAGLSRTFQSLELFEDLTVAENLAVAAGATTARPQRAGWLKDALGFRRPAAPAVAAVLADTGLSGVADRFGGELTTGQRHLVALARALVAQPRVVCLDEPGAGLDASERQRLGDAIGRLGAGGTAVVLVEHDLEFVFGVCERVWVLDAGQIIASGSPAAVRTDPAVRTAYLGVDASPAPGDDGGAHG